MMQINRPVVITRPLAQAIQMAAEVTALGRRAVVFPLLAISPVADPAELIAALSDLSVFSLVVFVSQNAIHAAFEHISALPSHLKIAVMGQASRATLAEYGVTTNIVSPADESRADSETLLAAIDVNALRGQKVLIVRGNTGREWLADALEKHGVFVSKITAYQRTMPQLSDEQINTLRALLNTQCDWMISSSEGLRNLVQLVSMHCRQDAQVCLQQHLIVSHARIKEIAHELSFSNVSLIGAGALNALTALQ